jgi:hypothetical protein
LNALATAEARARFVRDQLPSHGLFAGHTWRLSPDPFFLETDQVQLLERLGRVLLQFYRAVNLLYRQSVAGKQPPWVAEWLDRGKPAELLELQRSAAFKNDVPRVIRPDLLLTDQGVSITELDSVPGGIGLTGWLNRTYSEIAESQYSVIGGADGMTSGFASIFGDAPRVHIIVSEESATYRPEMEWLVEQLDRNRFAVHAADFTAFADGDAVYRFFELFDLKNVPAATALFRAAEQKRIRMTPPPKPVFEEKMLFALLWNRNLQGYWRRELGESFLGQLQAMIPYTWIIDPAPLPPQAAIPELSLTDWQQLKALSQRERDLILKVSGFSDQAWGARSVYLGSDLSHADWATAIDTAIGSFQQTPYVLQRYHRPKVISGTWFDFENGQAITMAGRTRLCPYYFVSGDGDNARAKLGGVLATVCPADKKIIHGMKAAILQPAAVRTTAPTVPSAASPNGSSSPAG